MSERRGHQGPSHPRTRKLSRSFRAQLKFPVSRVEYFLRQGRYAQRLAEEAPVFLAAVLEYLTAEILELAGNVAYDNEKSRIAPSHVHQAIRSDAELNQLFGHIIPEDEDLPNTHSQQSSKTRSYQSPVKAK